MYEITKILKFEAAHYLPEYCGKCREPHGHNFKVEVTLQSPTLCERGHSSGMIVDFTILKQKVEPILEEIDHKFLNDIIEYPTAEHVAKWIFDRIKAALLEYDASLRLKQIVVWENDESRALYME